MCRKHNQPTSLKIVLLSFFVAGELSKATESFRQEMGVHFYASRSTSKVGFCQEHTCMSKACYTLFDFGPSPAKDDETRRHLWLWLHNDGPTWHSERGSQTADVRKAWDKILTVSDVWDDFLTM